MFEFLEEVRKGRKVRENEMKSKVEVLEMAGYGFQPSASIKSDPERILRNFGAFCSLLFLFSDARIPA